MPRVVSCSACRQSLTLPDQVASGQQVRCPACKFTMIVPGTPSSKSRSGVAESTIAVKSVKTDAMAKPVSVPKPAPRPSNPPVQRAVMAALPNAKATKPASSPSKPEVVDNDEPITPVKKKKKKKEADNKRLLYFGIGGMLLFVVCLVTALVVFIPWGKMFAGTPEAQIVDAYTAINSMGYNNAALRVLNSDTAALCIPGPRQVVVTRPNPHGKYLLLRLKVPYSDIDRHFQGVRDRIFLTRGHIQVEANGITKDVMYVQSDLAETGNFQMSYQPPQQEAKVDMRDYIGPKKEAHSSGARSWTSEGTVKEYSNDMTFETPAGLQVRISCGSERQDGGGGNIFEHLTGKKILGNKEAFTGSVEGFVFVDWNMGSAGFVVHNELEQPNEIGLNWNVTALVELPEGAKGDVTLKAVGTTRKLRLK